MTDATDGNWIPVAPVRVTSDPVDIATRPTGTEGVVFVSPADCLPPGATTPQCGAEAASCVCTIPPHGDDVPHHCTDENCGGVWSEDPFRIIRLPKLPAWISVLPFGFRCSHEA